MLPLAFSEYKSTVPKRFAQFQNIQLKSPEFSIRLEKATILGAFDTVVKIGNGEERCVGSAFNVNQIRSTEVNMIKAT